MPKIVIADTSTLILFSKIDEINLLQKVYNELITTPEIAEEFGDKLPDWIKIQSVSDKLLVTVVAIRDFGYGRVL